MDNEPPEIAEAFTVNGYELMVLDTEECNSCGDEKVCAELRSISGEFVTICADCLDTITATVRRAEDRG